MAPGAARAPWSSEILVWAVLLREGLEYPVLTQVGRWCILHWRAPCIQLLNKECKCLFRREKKIFKNILFCLVIRFLSHVLAHKLVLGMRHRDPGLRAWAFWPHPAFAGPSLHTVLESLYVLGIDLFNNSKIKPYLGHRLRNSPGMWFLCQVYRREKKQEVCKE